jgi:hypothetical protein
MLLTAELATYAAISGIGLLIAVYAMLHGSVQIKPNPADMITPPAGFNTPVIGAAVFAFGTIGYIFTRYSTMSTGLNFFAALVAGIVGWIGMTFLMAKWAFKGSLVDPHEEMEELQGIVAMVTKSISTDALGEISYIFRGEETRAPARSIDGAAVEAGTDVVIEKIENGVADVELWTVVEQRL